MALLPELIDEILLRSDLETINSYFMTHKCNMEQFWIRKLKDKVEIGKNLPSITFREHHTIEDYMKMLNVGVGNLSKVVTSLMRKAEYFAKRILLINKIEKNAKVNKTTGVIYSIFDENYFPREVKYILSKLLPTFSQTDGIFYDNYVKIELLDDVLYRVKYSGYDEFDKVSVKFLNVLVNEDIILEILTVSIFESLTLFKNANITDRNNELFLPSITNIIPERERIWDTLKYLKM